MKKFTGIFLAAVLVISVLTPAAYAAKATETISYTYSAGEGKTYTRQMEKLGRGLAAVKTDSGVYLSWRLLDSEDHRFGSSDSNVSFKIYRGSTEIAEVTGSSNYLDEGASGSNTYCVAPVVNGKTGSKCASVSSGRFTAAGSSGYFDIPLVRPENETVYAPDGTTVVHNNIPFYPADCSCGDVDGDGEYEIIVKWTSAEKDVGSPGNPAYSGTVRFAAYKLSGEKLWDNDINLGKNVYSSAHTVQFLVYDFNGDGKAEMICQTSLGSRDAKGRYVSHSAKADSAVAATGKSIAEFTDDENEAADYRGGGRIIEGEEFLTVFNGETGEAIDTIDLPTTRGSAMGVDYGDNFGNRSNRFVSDVAYLDGVKPYAVFLRGYYFSKNAWDPERTSIAGISFDGTRLSPDYRFDTKEGEEGYYEGAELYVGQGNHNCTVADVDNDGKDEFITGALCMEVKEDNSFKPRWCTFLEHGDALHIGDYDPTHNGFEFFTVHEDGNGLEEIPKDATDEQKEQINAKNAIKIAGPDGITGTDDDYGYVQENAAKAGKNVICNFGMSVIDADTGDIIFHKGNTRDTGRGCMANTGSGGYYQITGVGSYKCDGGTSFSTTRNGAGSNFRVFWDGDLYDELLDGTNVTNYNGDGFSAGNYECVKINGTKSNPSLQADLFGDWREELIYPTSSDGGITADGKALRVFMTTTQTNYKIKTLMQDPVYRSGVAAEQTAYNQPPHIGMYLSEELFKAKPERIEASLSNQILIKGKDFDKSYLTVTAFYDDGTSEDVTELAVISDFDNQKLGNQTVTVTYLGKTTEIEVTVIEQSIALMNGTYETSSSSQNSIPIGSHSGRFAIEHTMTINSLPANGSADKNSNDGFFVKFMPENAVGAGWYIDTNSMNIVWKSTSTTTVTTTPVELGKTYTFRYVFTNVADGSGAKVSLMIKDETGSIVGLKSGLDLRNMTSNNNKPETLTYPLASVYVYNQSPDASESSVTINGAKLISEDFEENGVYSVQINGQNVNLNLAGTDNIVIYAAKYDGDGVLTKRARLEPAESGTSTVTLDFEPDKVFIWNLNMRPLFI